MMNLLSFWPPWTWSDLFVKFIWRLLERAATKLEHDYSMGRQCHALNNDSSATRTYWCTSLPFINPENPNADERWWFLACCICSTLPSMLVLASFIQLGDSTLPQTHIFIYFRRTYLHTTGTKYLLKACLYIFNMTMILKQSSSEISKDRFISQKT